MVLVSMGPNHKGRSFLYKKFHIWYHYFKLEEENGLGMVMMMVWWWQGERWKNQKVSLKRYEKRNHLY